MVPCAIDLPVAVGLPVGDEIAARSGAGLPGGAGTFLAWSFWSISPTPVGSGAPRCASGRRPGAEPPAMAGPGRRRGFAGRIAAAALAGALLGACDEPRGPPPELAVPGGDPERGRAAMAAHGCTGCHVIPGVRGPYSWVGPPLDDYARRGYIAGHLPNRPPALVAWILDPPALVPGTAMPAVGVTAADARDMAAYLYTLGAEGAWEPQVVLGAPLAPPEHLAEYLAAQERLLRSSGPVGPEGTASRIPIDRAIELLTAPQAAAPAGGF